MRSGRLNTPATLLHLGQDLQACEIDWLWCGIQTKENAEPQPATGLRAPAKVTIRAWWDERIIRGRYLRTEDRLFLLDDVRDFTGKRQELAITASELVGLPGQALVSGLAPRPCRVFLAFDVPFVNQEYAEAPILRTYAEVALIEAGRVEEGDQLVASGVRYTVLSLAKDRDDGVVRGLWLEAES
ncbi:hypothetical protein [Metapseudomonas otitidis]|uniref:hypothetical protein n=1 Tax=Metapseudomonas otitidis TaxID=319939 RepID=UPI00209B7A3E|nr:hypothetical protein [Pseudomonas otitidis]MCO7558065.1 hypothetical protein [Pseudomonas otitidis]